MTTKDMTAHDRLVRSYLEEIGFHTWTYDKDHKTLLFFAFGQTIPSDPLVLLTQDARATLVAALEHDPEGAFSQTLPAPFDRVVRVKGERARGILFEITGTARL